MTDDFSNLESGASCYVLNNTTTIYSYKNNIRTSYIQIGGKWYRSSYSTYTNLPTNIVCWSYSDITSLNTNADMYPIYVMIAFMLACVVWFLFWSVFRRLFKWRVN